MLLLVMLAIILGLVAIAAFLGFLFALYALRPRLLAAFVDSLGLVVSLPAKVMLGLVLAAFIPVVAGLAYAMTGATWVAEVLGQFAGWYWIWVASAFAAGAALGLMLSHSES